jgi:hypothetical protein
MPVHQERGNLADGIKYATKIFKNYWTVKTTRFSNAMGMAAGTIRARAS